MANLGINCIKGTLLFHFSSSDKTDLSESAVCECLTFSDVLCGRNDSAVLQVDTNLNTKALLCVTQCWAANAVSTDERMFGHRRPSSANVSVTGNITSCVGIEVCLGI